MKIKELIDNSKISTSPKLFINRTFFILELLHKSHGLREFLPIHFPYLKCLGVSEVGRSDNSEKLPTHHT